MSETENGQKQAAFFLDADDAKSLGNIDYMRTAKTIKKTFPGTAGRQGFETVEIVSSQGKRLEGEPEKPAFSSPSFLSAVPSRPENGNGASAVVSPEDDSVSDIAEPEVEPEVPNRRQADSSMDMFRSMAKDIRKK
jgi:hypothetical protein